MEDLLKLWYDTYCFYNFNMPNKYNKQENALLILHAILH